MSCKKYDYIIVGDGSAGCLIARKLSDPIRKNGKCKFPRVLVLEAGENQIQQLGYPPNPTILDPKIISPNSFSDPQSTLNQLTNNPEYAFTYEALINGNTSDPILKGKTQIYSAGRGWGGGSSHFYQMSYRGTPERWDSFALYNGNPSWSYNSLLPIFKSLETYTPNAGGCFDGNQRGEHGVISIIQNSPANTIDPSSILVDPIIKEFAVNSNVGVGYVCDYNSGTQPNIGTSSVQTYQTTPVVNQYGRYRSWAHNSFLPIGTIINTEGKGLGGRKLKLKSNTLASRIIFEGTTAVGVEYLDTVTGEYHKVHGKNIIVCSGAIGTPQILQRSGVGDPNLLTPLGINVVVNNPNVGKNMNGNPSAGVIFTGSVDFGPLAIINTDLHNSSLSPSDPFYYPADGKRRMEIALASGNVFGLPNDTALTDCVVFSENYNGTVKIVSKDPTVSPKIDLDMFSDDTTGLVNGSTLNRIMAGFYNVKTVVDSLGAFLIAPPAEVFASPDVLSSFIKESASMQMHQVGTCRFGKTQNDAVVDSQFNVFGTKNLKVCDLSIYPYTVDGNPMFSVLTAAKKLTDLYLS